MSAEKRGTADPAAVVRFPWFSSLSPAEAAAAARLLEPVRLAAGEILFHEGDEGDSIYFLLSGQISLRLNVPGQPGKDEPLRVVLDAGAVFGEVGPFLSEPRTATAKGAGDATLWQLRYSALETALDHGEKWASRVLLPIVQALARRLRTVNRDMLTLLAERRKVEAAADARERTAQTTFDEELLGVFRRSLA